LYFNLKFCIVIESSVAYIKNCFQIFLKLLNIFLIFLLKKLAPCISSYICGFSWYTYSIFILSLIKTISTKNKKTLHNSACKLENKSKPLYKTSHDYLYNKAVSLNLYMLIRELPWLRAGMLLLCISWVRILIPPVRYNFNYFRLPPTCGTYTVRKRSTRPYMPKKYTRFFFAKITMPHVISWLVKTFAWPDSDWFW
jgi:hypothetical protein